MADNGAASGASGALNALSTFCFSVPHERFLYRLNGRWVLESPVGDKAILAHITRAGVDMKTAKGLLANGIYTTVYGIDIVPGAGEFVEQDGITLLNVYAPPTLKPEAGEWPRIQRVLEWLTNHEAKAYEWLINWMAAKVQNPALLPRTAVVFSGKPRSGKGTVAYLMQQMLGPENCASIGRRALDTQFNARWINKLFVLADEIADADRKRVVFEDLKILIANDWTELEAKFSNQARQRNRLAWFIATNDKIAPVVVENGDRRYTVLSNHAPLTDEYRSLIMGCWENERGGVPTASFAAELRGFFAYLLAYPVRHGEVSVPCVTSAKEALTKAAANSVEAFIEEVEEFGVERWLEAADIVRTVHGEAKRSATGEVEAHYLYSAYAAYCKATGMARHRKAGFEAGLANHTPAWTKTPRGDGAYYAVPAGASKAA